MKISKKGIVLIKKFEGLRLEAYRCSAGVWTIGWGHTKDVEAGDFITQSQADALLLEDLEEKEADLNKVLKIEVNQNQYDALLSFVFNLGIGNLKKSTLLKKLNAGDFEGAAEEFLKWVYAGGKKLDGLKKRREAERALFLTKKKEKNMDFKTIVGLGKVLSEAQEIAEGFQKSDEKADYVAVVVNKYIDLPALNEQQELKLFTAIVDMAEVLCEVFVKKNLAKDYKLYDEIKQAK